MRKLENAEERQNEDVLKSWKALLKTLLARSAGGRQVWAGQNEDAESILMLQAQDAW